MCTFVKYDLTQPDSYERFRKIEKDFLALMKKAYGEVRYFGDVKYKKKIEARDLEIIFAYDRADDSFPIGVLLMKPYGKLSGLAVLERHRRKKIGSELINFVKKDHQHLFGEVAVENTAMRSLMLKLDFVYIRDKEKMLELLRRENDKITILDELKQYTTYVHAKDKDNIPRARRFVMLEYEG